MLRIDLKIYLNECCDDLQINLLTEHFPAKWLNADTMTIQAW